MDGPNCIEAQICRGDFYDMLAVALRQCGGNPRMIHGDPELNDVLRKLGGTAPKPLVDQTLREVVDVLAQNGIRMVYMREKHIDRVQIASA